MPGSGLVASSRDRDLQSFGIPNDYLSTRAVKYGPWYNDDENDPGKYSCRHLNQCVTEFGAQGLELDAVLLAWGTDFRVFGDSWSIEKARKYLRRDIRQFATQRNCARTRIEFCSPAVATHTLCLWLRYLSWTRL